MTEPRGRAVDLRPEAEAAWDEVRTGLALHDGFWLAFVLGAQRHEVAEFAARSRDLARARVEPVDLVVVDDVPAALAALLTPRAPLAATWVDATARGTLVPLLQRLNERRDVVRRVRPAPLLVCCPEGTGGLVRDTAPDLWSIRTLVAPVERTAAPVADRAPLGPAGDGVTVAEGPAVAPSSAVEPRLRRMATAVGARRPEEALAAGRELVVAARTAEDVALGHAWLARALTLVDEDVEARRHALLALQPGLPLGRDLTLDLIDLLIGSDDPEVRLGAAEANVGLRRAALVDNPRSSDALRELVAALNLLTDARIDQGRIDASAATSAAESTALSRRLRTELGDNADTLRTLTYALSRLFDVQRAQGRLDDAHATAAESVALTRRVQTEFGDTPDTLRDLSVTANRLFDVQYDQGRLDDAHTTATESVALSRRLRAELGDNAETLRDLSVALGRLFDVQRDQGRLDDAHTTATESVALSRRLRAELGDTPQTLHDLTYALDRLFDVQRDQGHLDEAQNTATESVALSRRLRAELGDNAETLRDLSVALARLFEVQRDQGRLDDARIAATESVELRRRLRAELGDNPTTLRDLTYALNRLVDVQRDQGHLDDAHTTATESVELRRRLRAELGDTPTTLRDLTYTLMRLFDVQRDQGHLDEAHTTATESVALSRRLRAELGEAMPTLRDLSRALDQQGRALGTTATRGRAAFTEALELDRTIVARFGASPLALRDLSVSAMRVAEIEETDGNPTAALALYREALEAAEAVEGRADNTWRDKLREAVERVRAELDRGREAPPDDA